ncbi:MAG: glycosyltransferase family 4 protein [Patescibacteria group bacterium]
MTKKKLLILTQKVNRNDPILGFFCAWIRELSGEFQFVTVICLETGEYSPPSNVSVFSLGKKGGRSSRLRYMIRFWKLIFSKRKNYDLVLVHMNQEYTLLGGFIWWAMRKPVYMWRNHHTGSWLTGLSSLFCRRVFYTSRSSYTARYRKSMQMPAGIDTDFFCRQATISKNPRSILFLGRLDPSKRLDILVEALREVSRYEKNLSVLLYGAPSDVSSLRYVNNIKSRVQTYGLGDIFFFCGLVPNHETVNIYNASGIFVNLSPDGMFDKTIFEAMACETTVLVSNRHLCELFDARMCFSYGNSHELADKIRTLLLLDHQSIADFGRKLRRIVVDQHDLKLLTRQLAAVMSK